MKYHINTDALEMMASQGNSLAKLALSQRRQLAKIDTGETDLDKAERTIRSLHLRIDQLKSRIAELESLK